VHEVVEPEQLMVRATALAEELAAGPQAAMRMLKRSLYNAAETTLQQAFDDIAIRTAVTDYHPDAREGVNAFREKREARFS
jgi:2-(1,2-epoxy-1,2-dihydrophenyl)acetyl-CoA isomerase